MGHLGFRYAKLLLLGFAFLLTATENCVYSQGVNYPAESLRLYVKPLGSNNYLETNLYADAGDTLRAVGAVSVHNMNTYLVKFRCKAKLYDSNNDVVASGESETKYLMHDQTEHPIAQCTWVATSSGGCFAVKWIFYIQEDFNGDGDFNDAGEGEQESIHSATQFQPDE